MPDDRAKRPDLPKGLYWDPRSPHIQIDKAYGGARLRGSSGTTDSAEAQAIVEAWEFKQKQLLIAAKLGLKIDEPEIAANAMTLNDAVARYFEEVGRRAKSGDQTDQRLALVCEHFNKTGDGSRTTLGEITEIMLLDLAAIRRGLGKLGNKKTWQPVSELTINRMFDDLRAVMERARDVWKVPVAAINWGGVYAPKPKRGLFGRELPAEKDPEFFAALRPDLHEPVEFDMIHGARSGALMSMEWKHVDLDAGEFGAFKVRRKTREPGEHWQDVPLTSRSRELVLAQQGRHPKFVWTYVVHRRHRRWRAGQRRPLTKTVLRQQIEHATSKIGIGHLRVHDFRHTMARRTLRASKDLAAVQKALGHADIATTALYIDALTDDVRRALEATPTPRKTPGPAKADSSKPIGKTRKRRA